MEEKQKGKNGKTLKPEKRAEKKGTRKNSKKQQQRDYLKRNIKKIVSERLGYGDLGDS